MVETIGMVEEVERDTGFVDLYCLVMLKIDIVPRSFTNLECTGNPALYIFFRH
jgi:hypothetical protein